MKSAGCPRREIRLNRAEVVSVVGEECRERVDRIDHLFDECAGLTVRTYIRNRTVVLLQPADCGSGILDGEPRGQQGEFS